MAKHISKITKSLRELGEIQVNDWQLPEILKKDISEIEFRRALHRIGNIQVTDFELSQMLPAIRKVAKKEVDVVGLIKQAADYKVLDWELTDAFKHVSQNRDIPTDTEIQQIRQRLEGYLRYVVCSLIDEPDYASFQSEKVAADVVCFMVVLTPRDQSMLIGMNGLTATPIRQLLKAAANQHGVHALLKIRSHHEAAEA